MPKTKADTTIDNLIQLVKNSTSSKSEFDKLIKNIEKTIPIKGRRMPKVDPNLNKQFKIRRINHTIVATIRTKNENLYRGKIDSVEYDMNVEKQFVKAGDSLLISERELEITGKQIK